MGYWEAPRLGSDSFCGKAVIMVTRLSRGNRFRVTAIGKAQCTYDGRQEPKGLERSSGRNKHE